MKRIAPIILIAAAIATAVVPAIITTGCSTSSAPTDSQCARYRAVYEAYRASLEVRTPSKEEALAAAVAAAYLSASCGWTELKSRGDIGEGDSIIKDANGVPYLISP